MVLLTVILSAVALGLSVINLLNHYLARMEIYEYRTIMENSMRADSEAIAFLSSLNAEREAATVYKRQTDSDDEDAEYK